MTKLVSVEEAKLNLRVDGEHEDQIIRGMILAAENWVESDTGLALTNDAPAALRQAVLVLVTGFYNDREGGDVMAKAKACAVMLCQLHRVMAV